ncbi:hypothetical protein BACCIP111895_03913 [Neobacillus rhizosphaerae]|uniref:Uncharacterized protein n=1 Tax=Neobacillus rhizosphaerae TaxID=2880965 RepID=A0ABN8KVU2_9BACI|nr:hypothetical protein [Neobacillus rhizosphaerae]CAH2716725.1 hypothetical protein BACCIP111895_03913 [Neobacillus rhizosphaerae]
MTVLFGSVEYFEKEILRVAAQNPLNRLTHDHISMICSRLKSELLNDFVCEERIRVECLENLTQASCKLFKLEMRVTAE